MPPVSVDTLPQTPAKGGKAVDALSTSLADVERALAAKMDVAGKKKKAAKKTTAAKKKPAAAASPEKASSSGGAKKRPAAATGHEKPSI